MNSQQVSKKYLRLAAKSVIILMLLLLVGCSARSGREGAQVGQGAQATVVQSEEAVGAVSLSSPAAGNDEQAGNEKQASGAEGITTFLRGLPPTFC